MKIEFATVQDAPALADIFFSHLAAHPEYISHGEMQMGVGEGVIRDGVLVAQTAPDGRQKWMKYILIHIENEELARVWKALSDQGEIVGFVVADIEDDGDAPFGMVCDVLVKEACRGCGAGEALLQTAIPCGWLSSHHIVPGPAKEQGLRRFEVLFYIIISRRWIILIVLNRRGIICGLGIISPMVVHEEPFQVVKEVVVIISQQCDAIIYSVGCTSFICHSHG